MFTCLLSLLVMVATVESQSAWEAARTHRHSPQGFSLLGGHQQEPGTNRHAASHTAGHSTPPPSNGKISFQHSKAQSHGAAPEAGIINQQASPNKAAQSQKTMTAKNVQPTQSSNPSYHMKHDAGWAAATQQHHQKNNNLKRVIQSDKNRVVIVDHIWKMFQINSAAKPAQTPEVSNTNQVHAKPSGFRMKPRDTFVQPNKVQTDHKHVPMSTNHHNALNNHQQHNSIHNNNNHVANNMNNHTNNHMNHHHNNNHFNNNNQFINQVYNKSPYSNMNNQLINNQNHNNQQNTQYKNQHNNNNFNNNVNNNNNQFNNKNLTGGNYQGNVINPIKRVIKRVLSPYDKIQSGLETIKTEVGAQQGMLGQLQKSMDKMKEIFLAIQTDMKNVLNSINSIMNMQ